MFFDEQYSAGLLQQPPLWLCKVKKKKKRSGDPAENDENLCSYPFVSSELTWGK